MMVVADAGPLRYLLVIEVAEVLQPLYGRVLVPETVAAELQEAQTPATVRAWVAQPPDWCEIRPDPTAVDLELAFLDPGERGRHRARAGRAGRSLADRRLGGTRRS